jgi:hypothetical protein
MQGKSASLCSELQMPPDKIAAIQRLEGYCAQSVMTVIILGTPIKSPRKPQKGGMGQVPARGGEI